MVWPPALGLWWWVRKSQLKLMVKPFTYGQDVKGIGRGGILPILFRVAPYGLCPPIWLHLQDSTVSQSHHKLDNRAFTNGRAYIILYDLCQIVTRRTVLLSCDSKRMGSYLSVRRMIKNIKRQPNNFWSLGRVAESHVSFHDSSFSMRPS